ncbi:MAG: PAS domain S-box protein [Gammaproteobacteria bacterium]|nr:PAS domain S-box protein [Gammaproteobacteria bacterium]MDE2460440.1 PAS domain S-box protein [Gammaproteobacteria bacterium]
MADGVYVRQKSGRFIYVNEALCRISGYARAELTRMSLRELFVIAPQEFTRLFDYPTGSYFIHDIRKLRNKGGELRAVEVTAHALDDNRIGCVVHDLSEHVAAEAGWRSTAQLFSLMQGEINDVLFSLSVEQEEKYVFRHVNDAFYRVTGLNASQVIDRRVQDVIPEPSLSLVLGKYRTAIGERRSVIWEEASQYPAGTKYGQVSVTPVFNTQGECTELVGRVLDVTERKINEKQLERQKNLYAMLSQTNQAIVRLHDRDELFATVCRTAVEYGHLQFAAISLLDRNTHQLRVTFKYGQDANYMQFAQIFANPLDARGRGPSGEAIRTGHYVLCNDFLGDPRTQPWRDLARKCGIRASAAFPIRAGGEIIGVLSLYANVPDYFVEDLVPTLSEMATDISFALDNFLHQSERARLAAQRDQMIARIADGFLAVDRNWRISYINAMACELLGGEPQALIGKNVWSVTAQDVAAKLRQACEMCMFTQQPASSEEYFERSKSWYNVHIYPAPEGLTVYARNVTAHKQALANEQAHREELHQVSQRLLQVQESERRSLARELHDEVGQCVNAINLNLHAAGALAKDAALKQLIAEAAAITAQLDEQIGLLSLNLHPSVLDDLGLDAAFQWCLRTRFGGDSNKIQLQVESGLPRFDANVENVVFRVFQEALSNAFRHGGATQVNIALAREDEELVLSVSDNGQGFDLAAAMQAARAGKSLGLIGMQERARYAGGEISIHSEPGQGTRVELSLPATPR